MYKRQWEDRIKGAYASLRPSEQKVASFFLAHAGELESLTIGELASAAGVSEPTVIRCVRGLGYRGYRAFKGALRGWEAGEESAFDHLGGFSLRPWDRMENLPLKAVGTQREALEDVLKSVSPDSLAQAAQTLASARLIDLYSVETVSYTHLDVYKRQRNSCLLSFCRWRKGTACTPNAVTGS